MDKPLLSVCCMTYNHKSYIRQALDSVLCQQTNFPFEIIVHDDASTDGTVDIIREYEKDYPDIIHAIYQPEDKLSLGHKIYKEYVYPEVRGKYVAILECDDFWIDDQKLQTQVKYMEQHPECSGTFHAANWLSDGKFLKNDRHFDYECDITPQQMIAGGGVYCAMASLCFRSQYALDYPEFRELSPVGDYPLQILLSLRGVVHYFPEIMSCYRFSHENSWTKGMEVNKQRKINFLKKEIQSMKALDEYTNHMYSTEIYYIISKDICDLYVLNEVPFQELRDSFSHMKIGRMKLSRMRRGYDRLLRKYIPGIKQKY